MADMSCPLSRQVIRSWKRYVIAHPWQGDKMLKDPRHIVDTRAMTEKDRPIRLMLSFDCGYHESGWFANSDWEQNLHLSMSHPQLEKSALWTPGREDLGIPDGPKMQLETVSDEEARAWGRMIFGVDAPKAWFEPAASTFDPYRMPNIVHLRLFYDKNMQPFIPEGEPYKLKPWADGSSPEKVYGKHRAT